MTTSGKVKLAHPNRLVGQHDVFLANKSLVNKMRTVKSSIPQVNKDYEKKIVNRKKKEMSKNYYAGSMLDQDMLAAELEQRINHITNPTYGQDGQDEQPLDGRDWAYTGLRGSYEKPKTSTVYNAYLTNEYKLPKTASTREMGSRRRNSLVSSPKHVKFETPPESASNNVPYNDVGLATIKNQLMQKKIDMVVLNDELKDWWHEDAKHLQLNRAASDTRSGYIDDRSLTSPNNKENKKITATTTRKATSSENQFRINTHKNVKKENFASILPKKSNTSDFSSEKKPEKKFVSGSKSAAKIPIANKEVQQRPSTVKHPTRSGNDEFKIRFSSHFDSLANKQNTRYDISPSIKEKEEQFNFEDDNYGLRGSNLPSCGNIDEPIIQSDSEEVESPQPIVDARALMRQATAQKSKARYGSVMDILESTENEIIWNGGSLGNAESQLLKSGINQQDDDSRNSMVSNKDPNSMSISLLNPMDNMSGLY